MSGLDALAIIALGAIVLAILGAAELHPRIHQWAETTCQRIERSR